MICYPMYITNILSHMRKFIIIPLFASVLLFSNCSKDDQSKNAVEESAQDPDQLIKDGLKALGFNYDDVEINGDTIIVEGDIILYKSKLLDKTKPRQATTHAFPFIKYDDLFLKVYIQPQSGSTGFTSSEIAVIKSGINEFLSSNFPPTMGFFSITYTTNSADPHSVSVVQANLPSNVCGQADFPSAVIDNGFNAVQIGGNLRINIGQFRNNLNDSQRKFLIVHEFGHMLGFRHTNWRTDEPQYSGGYGAYGIPVTGNSSANPDPNSVFNSYTCGYSWNGFSDADIHSIKFITRGQTSSR